MYFSELANIAKGKQLQLFEDRPVITWMHDSRKAVVSDGTVFLAIGGMHRDGHAFIAELYEMGVRQFVVEKEINIGPQANVLVVRSSIEALQRIVAYHRSQIKCPVIGITGSNGKTIIKEWLYQLLSPDFKIAKNPASYNSQLGVPLSVWQIQDHHSLGIFEAGISTVNEMENLQAVLQPTFGIFTNIGSAHNEGFSSLEEKINEKLKLFKEAEFVIYCKDHVLIDTAVQKKGIRPFSWGTTSDADVMVRKSENSYDIYYHGRNFSLL